MIFLDNAATSLVKPRSVARNVAYGVSHLTSPGRGGYETSRDAARIAFQCRQRVGELLGADQPEQVIFTPSATVGLNIAIRTLVHPGDHVIISGYEHNAVTRTLASIPNLKVTILTGALFQPQEMVEQLRQTLTEKTAAVILCHISNVFGYVLPMDELAAECRNKGVPLIVDAAQSAGAAEVSLSRWGAAFVACPGHKGLYGPQGIGVLLCREELLPEPVITGGTGSASALREMPDFLPDRLEAGTHNMPGIYGLLAGISYVKQTSVARIGAHEIHLKNMLANELTQFQNVEFFASDANQAGVLSFRMKEMDSEMLGAKLAEMGVAVRSGLHCAPLAHQTAGTFETGTVRVSFSAFSTEQDVRELVRRLKKLNHPNPRPKVPGLPLPTRS